MEIFEESVHDGVITGLLTKMPNFGTDRNGIIATTHISVHHASSYSQN
ncbi:hypothetical protein CCP3SC1_1160006 [Gammaproteobacteria bacterium]